jgi:hypothetical protein
MRGWSTAEMVISRRKQDEEKFGPVSFYQPQIPNGLPRD